MPETLEERLARRARERAAPTAGADSTSIDDRLAARARERETGSAAAGDIVLPAAPKRSLLAQARIAKAQQDVENNKPESALMTGLRSTAIGVTGVAKTLLRGTAKLDEGLADTFETGPSKLTEYADKAANFLGRYEQGLRPDEASTGANPWAAAGGETAGEFSAGMLPYAAAGIAARPIVRGATALTEAAGAGRLGSLAARTIGKLAPGAGSATAEGFKTAARALPGHAAVNVAPGLLMDPDHNPLKDPQTIGFSLLGALMEGRVPHVRPKSGDGGARVVDAVTEGSKSLFGRARKAIADAIHPEATKELKTTKEQRDVAQREAETDHLTGAGNKRAFDRALPTAEKDPSTSIVKFDLNGFKAVNDVHLHDAGDAVLQGVPKIMAEVAKEAGIPERVFRVGGDEFAAIVPADVANTYRDLVEQKYGVQDHGADVRTSISGGVGETSAAADAQARTRKQIHKAEQGIKGRDDAGGVKIAPPTPAEVTAEQQNGVGPSSRVFSMKVSDLKRDPARFQYKQDVNDKGVTRNLGSVEKFNPDLAGAIGVWKDPADSHTYVVNGHHRYDLAERTGAERMDVHFIDAKTADEAKAHGALANIAEGQGTALDAAHFLKGTGYTPEDLKAHGVDLHGRIAKAGFSLSKLEPDIFSKVATGKISEPHGAIIGSSLEEPGMQRAAANLVENSPKQLTEAQVRELVAQVKSAGSERVTQDNLFGTDNQDVSLVYHRADIAAEIKKRLAGDKKLFGYVAKGDRASELARGGNTINVSSSAEIAKTSAILEEAFNREAHAAGDVGRAITEAARRIANGEKLKNVVDDIYEPIRSSVEASLPGGEGSRGEVHPGARENGQPTAAERVREEEAGVAAGEVDPAQDALFAPAPSDRVKSAAIRLKDGTVYTGGVHELARTAAREAGADLTGHETGFVSGSGRFLTHAQAEAIAGQRKTAIVGPEKVGKPAIRIVATGEIVEGYTHPDAGIRAVDEGKLPKDFWNHADAPTKAEDGFTTTHRPFVSREEAYKIAERAGQLTDATVNDNSWAQPNRKLLDTLDLNDADFHVPPNTSETPTPAFTLQHDVHGHHSGGQTDGTVVALDANGEPIGRLDYSYFQGELYPNMIRVKPENRRQGIGSALYDRVREEYPDAELAHGYATPEGQAFRKAYDERRQLDEQQPPELHAAPSQTAGEVDLFGQRVRNEPEQAGLFSDRAGTEESRNLAQTESAARSALEKLRESFRLETDPAKKAKTAATIAQLDKLVNRGEKISGQELEIRSIAEKTGDPVLEGDNGELFSPARSASPAAEEKILKGTKVVDDAGEPRIVYHGTGVTFDKWAEPGAENVFGPGYYFAESIDHARFYAASDGGFGGRSHEPNIRPVKLDIKKPLMADHPITPAEINRIRSIAREHFPDWQRAGDEVLDKATTGDELYVGLMASLGHDQARANAVLQKAGYDGISYIMSVDPHEFGLDEQFPDLEPFDDRIWVAFKEPQIRSTGDPIVLDPETLYSHAQGPKATVRRVAKILGPAAPQPADIKALFDISRNMAKALNAPLHAGRARLGQRKALGVFFTKSESIRVRDIADVSTVAHEIGHYVSKKYLGNPTRRVGGQTKIAGFGNVNNPGAPTTSLAKIQLTPGAKAELVQMGTDLYGSRKPAGGYGEEGIAQYFSFYVVDPTRMLAEAPEFHSILEREVYPKEPALKAILDQSALDYAAYEAAPPEAKIDAMISVDEKVRNLPSVRGIINAMLDKQHEIKLAVEELGGERDPRKNAGVLAQLTHGDAGAAENMIRHGVVDFHTKARVTRGVEEILKEIPRSRRQALRRYLVAEGTLELAGRSIKTGVDVADAQIVAKSLEGEFGKHAEELWGIRQALIDYRVEAGLLTEKEGELIKDKNQRRLGFFRVFDEHEVNTRGGAGSGFGRNSSGLQRIKGSSRRIVDPLESLLGDIYNTVHQSHTHQVMQQLVQHAQRTEGGARVVEVLTEAPQHIVQIPIERVIHQLLDLGFEIPPDMPPPQLMKLAAGVLESFQKNVTAGPRETKDMVIPMVKNGERFWVQIKDRRLFNSLKGLNREQLPMWAKIVGFPTRTLRAGSTLGLEFSGLNIARDAWQSSIFSEGGWHLPGYNLSRGLFSLLGKDQYYHRWQLEGGDNASMQGLDRATRQRSLKNFLRSPGEVLRDVVLHPIDTMRILSSISDNATRLGEFKTVMEKELAGGEPKAAAAKTGTLASRNTSLDFHKSGVVGQHLNNIIEFFNPAVQGVEQITREFRRRPGTVTMRAVASITIPSLAIYMLQKDDPVYREIPRWQKDLFWIWVQRGEDGKVKHVWRVPKPRELGIVFGSVPERILEWVNDRDPHTLDNIGKTILEVASPSYFPTLLKPVIENWSNKSLFTDRPIVPRSVQRFDPAHQSSRYSSQTARQLGEIFGYSPAKIDNWIRGYTGRIGSQYAVPAIDSVIRRARRLLGKEQLSPERDSQGVLDVPGLRAFAVRQPGYDAESVEQVYQRFESAEQKRQTWKMLLEEGHGAEAKQYFQEHKAEIITVLTKDDGGSSGILREAYTTIGKLQDVAHDIENAKHLSKADREEKLRRVYDAMIKVAQSVNPHHRREAPAPDPVDVELEKLGLKLPAELASVARAAVNSPEYQAIDGIAAELVANDPKYSSSNKGALARELKKSHIETAIAAFRRSAK